MNLPLCLRLPSLPPSVGGDRPAARLATALTALLLACVVLVLPAAPVRADAGDRAQIENASSHSLGLFARYKKDAPGVAARFYVLAPGHQTDDDYEPLALLVPPGVSLSSADRATTSGVTPKPRLAPITPNLPLTVQDSAPAEAADTQGADAPIGFVLDQPVPDLVSALPGVDELPGFDQATLDQQPETAPLD